MQTKQKNISFSFSRNQKTVVMYAGGASPFVGWLAVDEFAELLAFYLNAKLESPKLLKTNLLSDRIFGRNRFEEIHSSGGDLLIIVARAPTDLNMVKSIGGYRKKFNKIIGVITDSYHQPSYMDVTSEFDAVFVTAVGDIDFVKKMFNANVQHMYQGIDTLRWGPKHETQRNVDLVGFGRMPASYQERFIQTFHQSDNPYLYLHSPLGNITGPTIGLERGMLFKLLQRSKISLAFNLHVGATGKRPISMMVTSRWLESMLSGCIVAGKRPVSRMADEMLFWENSTVELSDQAEVAVDQLIGVLENNDSYANQRLNNIYNVMNFHDWRFRIRQFSEIMKIEFNEQLQVDIDNIKHSSEKWKAI